MEWIGISGSGRGITDQVEKDVRETIRRIVSDGNGSVTGGVLGVDYIATDEVLSLNASQNIKVCLPAPFEFYIAHIRERADITSEEHEALNKQLHLLVTMNPDAIIALKDTPEVTGESYMRRNDLIVSLIDRLIAFSVNNSKGTHYTITKAHELHIETEIHRYTVES